MIPDQPNGANGDQFSGFTNFMPAKMKKRTAASLMNTIVALKRALSRMPTTRRAVIARTMITAGRFMTAPGIVPGAAHIQAGRWMPKPARSCCM